MKNTFSLSILLSLSVSLYAQDLLISDFSGTSPALNTPWMGVGYLHPDVAFSGWQLGEGIHAAEGDDALVFSVFGPADTPSTLQAALDGNQYLAIMLTPNDLQRLDLALLEVAFTIERLSYHAPRQYAVFTSVDGWETSDDVLFTSPLFDSSDFSATTHRFFLPNREEFNGIEEPFELRIIPFGSNYAWHNTSLTAFSMTRFDGDVYQIDLGTMGEGRVWMEPDATTHRAGEHVRIHAEPEDGWVFQGWEGDMEGRGNPLHLTVESDLSLRASFVERPETTMIVGTNLGGVSDWGSDWPFIDMFKKSRDWLTRNADDSGTWDSNRSAQAPRDENGYVTHIPFNPPGGGSPQYIHTIIHNIHQAGPWELRMEGTGSLRLSWSGSNGWQSFEINGGGTVIPMEVVQPLTQVFLEVRTSDAEDHIRDIQLVPADSIAVDDLPFHPLYIERLRPFSMLRFMDWARTNGSPLADWENRTTPDHNTQARREGVAFEYMIELANYLGQDIWVTIPHLADDDFVRRTAALFRDQARNDLTIWVEYSNETWNFHHDFSQTAYMAQRGAELGLHADDFRAGQRYAVLRSIQIWEIFEEEFAGDSDRLVCVLGTQFGWDDITSIRIAAMNDPDINPNRTIADALAIAPYFGRNYSPSELATNGYPEVEDIVGDVSRDIMNWTRNRVAWHREIADRQGMILVCYEGGQHFVGTAGAEGDNTLTEILIEANRHPAMYDRYLEYLDMLEEEGVSHFANFSYVAEPSRWGSWGVLEYQDQPIDEAHKYRALVDWITSRQDESAKETSLWRLY